MKVGSETLINDLIERTHEAIHHVGKLQQSSFEQLNCKPSKEGWSVLECIEHLNLYGEYYLPEIERRISESQFKNEIEFKSGLLGNYFAESMLPREKLNKMKTFKDKNPSGSNLTLATIDKFIEQQHKTLELLHQSRTVSLMNTKTSISITKLIKLPLGDTFRVLIYHNQRHIVQAFNVLKNCK